MEAWKGSKGTDDSLSSTTRVFQIFGLQFFTLDNSTENRKFNHRGESISTKFKFLFCCQIALLLLLLGAFVSLSECDGELKVDKIIKIGGCVIVGLSIIQSFITTSKVKSIFRLHEDVGELFRRRLSLDDESSALSKNFSKLLCTFNVVQVFIITTALGSSFLFHGSSALYVAAFKSCIRYIAGVNLLRVVFYTRLVGDNISLMRKAIAKFHGNAKLEKVPRENLTFKFTSLKEIYGKVWEMTDLINDVSGPVLVYMIVYVVVGSAVNGMKAYSIIKSDGFQGAIGLSTLFEVIGRGMQLTLSCRSNLANGDFCCRSLLPRYLQQLGVLERKFALSPNIIIYFSQTFRCKDSYSI